jgi:hypothetical protein
VLLPAYGDDAAAEALWERLRTEAPTRRLGLGRANALVARSLLLAPDASIEGEAAAAVELQATGWVAWVDRCLPGDSEGSLLHPPRLPFGAEALPPLRLWLEVLSAGLTERAAEAAQERSLSQQSQQERARALALMCAVMTYDENEELHHALVLFVCPLATWVQQL